MIKAIGVRNFRSLRDVRLELRDRNVLIGPNKSGKSSILDALQFICQSITFGDVVKPMNDRGGFGSVAWKGQSVGGDSLSRGLGTMEFELEGEISDGGLGSIKFTYLLRISGNPMGWVFVDREILDVQIAQTRQKLIEAEGSEAVARKLDGQQLFSNPGARVKPILSYDLPGWEASIIKNWITQWHFFDLIPQLAKVTSNSAAAVTALDVRGTNLSAWMHTLQNNHPKEFQRIEKLFLDAFPEVESLGTIVTQAGTTFVTTRERRLQSPIFIFEASPGELKFLMLVSLVYSPFGVPVLCIEEPENHLHPRLLSLSVEILNQRRMELGGEVAQVIATTHSPYLVDVLEPEDIVLVEKREGETVCRRPSSGEELRRLIREAETTLGRLWFSGSLGSV